MLCGTNVPLSFGQIQHGVQIIMNDKTINLTITSNDGYLYEFIKNCKNDETIKMYLRDAAELYTFCNSDSGIQEGHLTPENFRDRVLINKTEEELLNLKKEYEKEVLLFTSDFHPDECDCGIMRGPDTEYWFVDEDSRLGFITLYSNYIKMIDEILNKEIGGNNDIK